MISSVRRGITIRFESHSHSPIRKGQPRTSRPVLILAPSGNRTNMEGQSALASFSLATHFSAIKQWVAPVSNKIRRQRPRNMIVHAADGAEVSSDCRNTRDCWGGASLGPACSASNAILESCLSSIWPPAPGALGVACWYPRPPRPPRPLPRPPRAPPSPLPPR